jgi:hypothetical protein
MSMSSDRSLDTTGSHGSGIVVIEDRTNRQSRLDGGPLLMFLPSRPTMRDYDSKLSGHSTPSPGPRRNEPLQPSSLALSLRASLHYHGNFSAPDGSVSNNPASPESPQPDDQTAIVRIYLTHSNLSLICSSRSQPFLANYFCMAGHRFVWMDCRTVFGRIPCYLLQNSRSILRSDKGTSLLFQLARV